MDYEPNSFGGPVVNHSFAKPPMRINGDADRYTTYPGDDVDLYAQPRFLWEKVLDDQGRSNLVDNIVASMSNPTMGIADPRPIQECMLKHWFKVHSDMGLRIAEGLGVTSHQRAAE